MLDSDFMSLIPMRLLMLSAVLCLAGCRSVEREGGGDSARFSGGDSFNSTELVMENSRLSQYTIGHNGANRKRTKTKKLTPEELAAFWKDLEQTGVYRWRTRYEPHGKIPLSDPGSWDITIYKDGKQVFQSMGYGGYPSDADPQKTTSFVTPDRMYRVTNLFKPDPRDRAKLAPLKDGHE
jgi:hypothetical protein